MTNVQQIDWPTLKTFLATYSIPLHWVDLGTVYYIKAFQENFEVECNLVKDGGANQLDFENNYKGKGNKAAVHLSNVQSIAPFGSKTIVDNTGVTRNLFLRHTGAQYPVVIGANNLVYTATYPWAKMIGIEIINSSALDFADFMVYDTPQGTYSGVNNKQLNQFAFSANLPAGYYQRLAEFDADLYQGMIIKINYTSTSAKTVGINFILNEVK